MGLPPKYSNDTSLGISEMSKLSELEDHIAAKYKTGKVDTKEAQEIDAVLKQSELMSAKKFETASMLPVRCPRGTYYIVINRIQLYQAYVYNTVHSQGQSTGDVYGFDAVGMIKLDKKYGHIFMRPETWTDRITDHFVHADIDFTAHPEFSKRYYLLADKRENAENFFIPALVKLLEQCKELALEVKEDILLLTYYNMPAGTVLDPLARLTEQVAEALWM